MHGPIVPILCLIITLAAPGLCETCASEPAQGHAPMLDFAGPEVPEGWYTVAREGVLSIVNERGRRALQLDWVPKTGEGWALVGVKGLTVEGRPRSLAFSFMAEGITPVMFGVSEADGSTYQGYCYTPGGRWHDLLVDLDELMLADDSEDENGRLNVDQIAELIIVDLSNLSGEVGQSLGIKDGPQRLWLADLRLSDALAPHRSGWTDDGARIIYDFERDPVACLPLGSPLIELVAGPDDADPGAIRLTYDKDGYRWVGFVAGVGHLDLSGEADVRLTLKAANAARLTVVLEEWDGSKYATVVKLDPANGWYTVRLPFDRFKLDPDTEDENAALDLDQLRVIIPVVDAHRAEVDAHGRGSYTLSRIWCGH
jgi:hypothetical protein